MTRLFRHNIIGAGYHGPSTMDGSVIDFLSSPIFNVNTAKEYVFIPGENIDLYVYIWGAAGGTGINGSNITYPGGAGGYVTGRMTFLAGQTYRLWVGQGGGHRTDAVPFGGGGQTGAVNIANVYQGQGGGLSGIFKGNAVQANAIIIAGAGGGCGAGATSPKAGGAGQDASPLTGNAAGGHKGTTTAGGLGGSGLYGAAQPGTALKGGDSVISSFSGGGGGSGYFGGGGGGGNNSNGGPGAGGASYIDTTTVLSSLLADANYTVQGGNTHSYNAGAGAPKTITQVPNGTATLANTVGANGRLILSVNPLS